MDETERVFAAALRALRSGESVAVATIIGVRGSGPRSAGAKMAVHCNGQTVGTVGGGAGEAAIIEEARAGLCEGRHRAWEVALNDDGVVGLGCTGGMRVFIEVLVGRQMIVVVGAGHVGQALAHLGAGLGYGITVVDDRAALLDPNRFPADCELLAGAPETVLQGLAIGPEVFVAIVTRHEARDELVLSVLAEKGPRYVGLMGGRRRTEATIARARALGVREAFMQQVHSPIGLAIGAESPQEIAVSILAQIISVAHQDEREPRDPPRDSAADGRQPDRPAVSGRAPMV